MTGAADSLAPIFGRDGTRLFFKSSVDDLVANDANTTADLFTLATPGDEFATLANGGLSIGGSALADSISATPGKDVLDGGSSNDKCYAADGAADVLLGGKGTDFANVDASLDVLNSIESGSNARGGWISNLASR